MTSPYSPLFLFFSVIDMVLLVSVTWQRHPRDYPATFSQRLSVVTRMLLVTCYQLGYGLGDDFLLFRKSHYLVITTAQGLHKDYPVTCRKSSRKREVLHRSSSSLLAVIGWAGDILQISRGNDNVRTY